MSTAVPELHSTRAFLGILRVECNSGGVGEVAVLADWVVR